MGSNNRVMSGNAEFERQCKVNPERLQDSLEVLASFGMVPGKGITRPSFSRSYEQARAWLKSEAESAGLLAYDDAVGNLFIRYGDRDRPCVMSGSHIDTVPGGGPFDGAYGVLGAIEVARRLKETKENATVAFEAAAFVEEEGRYYDLLGSKALAGQMSLEEIEEARDSSGAPLMEAMKSAGFSPERFAEAKRESGDILAYVELHIEQGPVLESKNIPIGIVDEITGGRQIEYVFAGESGHAGTVPMDLRRDAFTGALEFIHGARAHVLETGTPGRVRTTFGTVEVSPGFPSRIPDRCLVIQEIRDFSQQKLDELVSASVAHAQTCARKYRLDVSSREICAASPARMSSRVTAKIREAARATDSDFITMPSGAGHDAQVIASIAPAGMIFVPSKGGISHRHDEWTDFEFLERGANVLLNSILLILRDSNFDPTIQSEF